MPKQKPNPEGPEAPSRAAGGCVLAVLAGLVFAVAFAVDEAAGVLSLVAAATFALWRTARRVSDSSAPPPPGVDRPSCSECAGQELVGVAPLDNQKGMWIYKTAPTDRPNHTHIHVSATPPRA
ncbi:hypothetical protein ACGFZR_24715 [Streptomyces sp. NPDC048241]|uniref:hypothetical protein n=1 Tax=Streptomyces sp. NPDC048241 TaxID=3365521 RepID=UPI003710051E